MISDDKILICVRVGISFIILMLLIISFINVNKNEKNELKDINAEYDRINRLSLTEPDPLQVRKWYEDYIMIVAFYPKWRLLLPLSVFVAMVATFNTFLFHKYGSDALVETTFLNFLFVYVTITSIASYYSWHVLKNCINKEYKDAETYSR